MDVVLLSPGAPPAPLAALPSAVRVRTDRGFAAPSRRFDVAIAAGWEATVHLFSVQAERYVYWVDDLAHHRMGAWQVERIAAALSYDLPVDFVAAGAWIASELRSLRPQSRIHTAIPPLPALPEGSDPFGSASGKSGNPLAVLIDEAGGGAGEASPAPAVLAGMAEAHRSDVLDPERPGVPADVVLRLAPLGGLLAPVVAAAAAGAVPLVLPGSGQEDLVTHLEDGIVLEPDDPRGTARWLDHLARDRELLATLREGALARGARWPTPAAATASLQDALGQLLAAPPPPEAGWPTRLMADAMAGVALHRSDYFVTSEELARLRADETYRTAQALRRRLDDPRLAGVRRASGPLVRAAKRRLGA